MVGLGPTKTSIKTLFYRSRSPRPNTQSDSAILENKKVYNQVVDNNSTEARQTVADDALQPVVDNISSESNSLWNQAFQSLSKQKQEQLKHISSEQIPVFCQADLDVLREEVQRKQDQCEANAWKIQIQDHNIIIRDYGAKIASWLQKIGDVVIPFAPAEASPPWGLVKGLLQVVISHSEQMLLLLGTVEMVVQVIWHGRVYESVFCSSPDIIHADALDRLQTALVKVYKVVLELFAYTAEQLSKGTSKQFIEALVNPAGASGLMGELQDQQKELDRVVSTCEISRSAATDSRLMQELQAINAPLARIDGRIETYFSKIDEERSLAILEQVSSILHNRYHISIQRDRTPDTCEWIVQSDEFCSWEKTSSPAILWLWGSPGTGKTFLTSKVIDRLKATLEQNVNDEGLAFFYCNRNEESRRQPVSVLQSFLRQLASTLRNPDYIQKDLIAAYTENRRDGREFDETRCRELLLKSFNLYPRTTLVLDALDECDPHSRHRLLEFFNDIANEASKPVKIFISSRPDEDIRRTFRAGPNIGIETKKTHGDIKKFIKKRLSELSISHTAIRMSQEQITTALLAKCDGMFQWTYLQLEQLKEFYSAEAIQSRLNSLPETLKEAYDELYGKISRLDEHDRRLADRAFQWVMAAATPLTSDELLCAIQIDPTREQLELSGGITENDLLSLCQHFLVIDSERAVWKVSHLSVREYFEQHHWTLQRAHLNVGNACLLVLLHPDGNTQPDSSIVTPQSGFFDTKSRLQSYLRTTWILHVQAQEGHDSAAFSSMTQLLERFFGSPTNSSIWFRSWLTHVQKFSYAIYGSSEADMINFSPAEYPMFVICYFGIHAALGDWWDNITDCHHQVNLKKRGLLYVAVEGGYYPICEALLREGFHIDINGMQRDPEITLQAAAQNGNLDILKLLIKYYRSDLLNIPSKWSIITSAVSGGNLDVVEYLISKDRADINLPLNSYYRSALGFAIAANNLDMVKYLVRRGAHLNIYRSSKYSSALAFTSYCGSFAVIEFLIPTQADAKQPLQDGKFGSILTTATASHHYMREMRETIRILRYLIHEVGVEVEMELLGSYGTALIAAAHHDNQEVVKLLLIAGVNVNTVVEMGLYGTALIAATCGPDVHVDFVRYLIEKHGADVNVSMHTGSYGIALVSAIMNPYLHNNLELCKYLICEAGAEVNGTLQVGEYGSPLIAAICHHKSELIELMISKANADVNLPIQVGDYGSALIAAILLEDQKESFKLVDYLVSKCGADVNLKPSVGNFGSALAAATGLGLKRHAKLLVHEGADPNMLLERGLSGSALAAATTSHSDCSSIIISELDGEWEADVDLLLTRGIGSALATAAALGHTDDVRLLIREYKADPNLVLMRNTYGSALCAAAYFGRTDSVNVLLDEGALVSLKVDDERFSYAMEAANARISQEEFDLFQDHLESESTIQQNKEEISKLFRSLVEDSD